MIHYRLKKGEFSCRISQIAMSIVVVGMGRSFDLKVQVTSLFLSLQRCCLSLIILESSNSDVLLARYQATGDLIAVHVFQSRNYPSALFCL